MPDRRGKCERLPTPTRPGRTGSTHCIGALRVDRHSYPKAMRGDQRVPRSTNTYHASTEDGGVSFRVTRKSYRAKNLITVKVRVLSWAFCVLFSFIINKLQRSNKKIRPSVPWPHGSRAVYVSGRKTVANIGRSN